MKNLKIIVLVIAAHVVGLVAMMTVQGCRSTTGQPNSASAASGESDAPVVAAATPAAVAPAPAANTAPAFQPIALNLPSSGAAPATPAPDRYAPMRPNDPAAKEYRAAQTYTVARNDTLAGIAKKFGFTADEIAKANNLPKKVTLQIGKQLIIPAKTGPAAAATSVPGAPVAGGEGTYTVKSGDSLYVIAKKYHVTVAALRFANDLTSDALKVGQVLKLPGGGAAPSTGASGDPHVSGGAVAAKNPAASSTAGWEAPAGPAPAPAKNGSAAAGFGRHVVGYGETLNGIAARYKVSQVAIMQANGLTNPKSIRAGQELRIPGAATTAAPPQPAIESTAPAPVTPANGADTVVPASDDAPVVKADDAVVPAGK